LLTETLSASSTTGKSLDVSFTESIPPAIASDPGNLTFSLAPAKITPEKHLAEWTLQVPAHGVTLITFRVAVPPGGPAKARLRQWARDLAALPAAQSEPIPAVQVKTLEIKPKAIHISVGKTLRADLSGTLSDGKAAPEAELAGVTWETRDPSIATVSPSGVLTGRAAGQTTLLVRIGAAHLTVPVIVSKPAGPSPPAPTPTGTTPVPSPPPSSAPPSSTPTPNPTPTLTPKPL
jgi:hypothetical protein